MKGYSLPLSRPRRIVNDMLAEARRIPTVPVQRTMSIPQVLAWRADHADPRPSWTAILTWAFAQVAAEMPVLRQVYLGQPWPRLYQYPASTATVALERDFQGAKIVLLAKIKNPESLSLAALEAQIQHWKQSPLEAIPEFQRAMRLAAWPTLVRRVLWRVLMNWGRQRANYCGTFSVTSYAALGAESLHPIGPGTVTMTYGPLDATGRFTVRWIYDHRVTDGATIARGLARMETVLQSLPEPQAGLYTTRASLSPERFTMVHG